VELSSVITWACGRSDILGSVILNIPGTKKMCSVSVSHGKLLRVLVVD